MVEGVEGRGNLDNVVAIRKVISCGFSRRSFEGPDQVSETIFEEVCLLKGNEGEAPRATDRLPRD